MSAERVTNLPLPPHSVQAEQAVIGSLLLGDARTWALIEPLVSPGDFYRPDHQLVFDAIAQLARGGAATDIVPVIAHLERRGELDAAGGLAYLSSLARETPTAANAPEYARVVHDRATMRRMLGIADSIQREIHGRGSQSAVELLAAAQERLTALQTQSRRGSGLVDAHTLATEFFADLDRRREGATGLQLGIADFDHLTGGVEPGDLVIFAGRPGMGKTALLVTIAAHTARSGPVAVFSAEMPAMQLTRRAVALLGEVDQGRLKKPPRMSDDDWARATHGTRSFGDLQLFVDDTAEPSLSHVRGECVLRRARGGLSLVMIDYVQLVRGRSERRTDELREVAYGCKALAKELSVPVILLAQLNRGVESRDRKRPQLSDLRDSGSIEEAADIVGMLYSEGYYNREFAMPQVLECSIEKHRNGERGQCLWHFAGQFSRVVALEDGARLQYRHLLAGKPGGAGEWPGGQQAAS